MKIALVGPTGFVGSKVLTEAVDRGHEVTAICRNPGKVPTLDGVTAVKADILDHKQAAAAFAGHDIVISCFNAGHHPEPGQNVYRDIIEGVTSMIRAVKEAGVRRFLFVGGGGALYVEPGVQSIDNAQEIASGEISGADFPPELVAMMPPEFALWTGMFGPEVKHENVVPLVRALMLFEHDQTYDWSFLSPPPGLHPGKRKGTYELAGNELTMVKGRFSGLSLDDLAIAIVDEVEAERHSRKHWSAYDPED